MEPKDPPRDNGAAKRFEISITNKDTGDVIQHVTIAAEDHKKLATYLRKIATLISSHAE